MTGIIRSRLGSGPSLVGWLRSFVIMVCAALTVAFVYYEWSTRESLFRKAENDALMLSTSLGQHAQDTFEMADVLMTAASARIAVSDRSLADLYVIDDALAVQLRQAWRIRSIMAFDENGRQFVSSQPQVQDWFDLSRTDAFDYHAVHTENDLRIGTPVRSPTNDDWIVPITRRLQKPDGTFGGIMVATIRINYFVGFYKTFGDAAGSIISLLSKDGILLARYPLIEPMIGRNFAGDLWKSDVTKKRSGTLRNSSPVDGVARFNGFTNVADYPLVVFVGVGRDAVTAVWLRDAVMPLIAAIGLIALFGLLGMKLVKHVRLRQESQMALMLLARTDGLTGLMNRRSFDEAMGKAWITTTPTKPVSLLLLDVDHFKAFNDAYGHPAGDSCLRLVASSMTETVYKPADRVARYGGEEFAVLLPDTNEASALIVAERIRASIEQLGSPNRDSAVKPFVTVSIGISTHRPSEGARSTVDEFLKDADRALYKAKLLGRNQIQTSSLYAVPRQPVSGSA